MNPELKPCCPESITRISFNPYLNDPDLAFEGMVNPYEIDQNKILTSKAFRRESDKTQVFFNSDNPHIRNRSVHTHEVTAISSTVSHSLNLNSSLTKAIALGHDLGHGPAGHLFEKVTEEIGLEFEHEKFSGIVTSFVERNGDGLNLNKETVKGILEHSLKDRDTSHPVNENLTVMYSDKIAYIFSDLNDFMRQGWISETDYKLIDSYFPGTQRDRVNQCIFALIKESLDKGYVSFKDSDTAQNFMKVRGLMYEYYIKTDHSVLTETIKGVYDSISHIDQLKNYDPTLVMALMTDKEMFKLGSLSLNRRVKFDDLLGFGVFEIIQNDFLSGQTYKDLNIRLQQKLN